MWWTSPRTAVTATFQFVNANTSDEPVDAEFYPSRESVDSSIGLNLGLEQHMRLCKGVSSYIRFLIGSVMRRGETTSTYHSEGNPRRYEDSSTIYLVRAGMSLRLDYFLTRNISVASEHSFLFERLSGTERTTDCATDAELYVSSFTVGFETSGLSLSVYF